MAFKKGFIKGGAKFKELQRTVAKGYAGKKVKPKFQAKYGKTYSRKEAMQVGKTVAGKMFWKTRGKVGGRKILREAK